METIEFDIITAKNVLSTIDGAINSDIRTAENLRKVCSDLDIIWQSESERRFQELFDVEITRWSRLTDQIHGIRNALDAEIKKWEQAASRLGP